MNSWVQMGVNSNGEEVEINDTDESNQEIGQINYKQQYQQLKKKLKLLLFVSTYFAFSVNTDLMITIASLISGKRVFPRESATESETTVESVPRSLIFVGQTTDV